MLKDNVLLVKYETYMSTVSYMKAVSLFQCLKNLSPQIIKYINHHHHFQGTGTYFIVITILQYFYIIGNVLPPSTAAHNNGTFICRVVLYLTNYRLT